MHHPRPRAVLIASRIESVLFHRHWPFRLARALGHEPRVRTVEHRVVLDRGSVPLPPLRLAYASDFHAGPTTDPVLLRRAIVALREAHPDILLLGGDFVALDPSEADWLADELGNIPAPFGRFAVLGNHDWWAGPEPIVRRLEASGIEVLTNRNTRLESPFDRVWICGVDDHWCGKPDGRKAFEGATDIRVVLMHAPSGLLDLGQERFNLALCGHTHGGQIALPGGVPILVPWGPLSRQYARGRFELPGGATLVVSVGVGCVVLPLRLFTQPEIVVCTLVGEPVDDFSPRPAAGFAEGQ
jgi:predicted MPP superfamily phosphohydrolase